MNICLKEDLKYIEQIPNGNWLVRYGIVPAGHTPDGKELVTFASSEYPHKPTMDQIRRSIHRYAMAHLKDENILGGIANPDLTVYQYVESNVFPVQRKTTIIFENEDEYEDY